MTDKHQNLWGNPDGGPSALEQAQEEKAGNLLLPRQLDSKASPPESLSRNIISLTHPMHSCINYWCFEARVLSLGVVQGEGGHVFSLNLEYLLF